jgi:hypothetical protein
VPNRPMNNANLEELTFVEIDLSDTRTLLVFNLPSSNHVPNLRLHKEYETDPPTWKRFKHERAYQLELGVRVVRALMSENNRTTIRDRWPRGRTERLNAIRKAPSKRTFRKDPWFM